MTATNSLDTSIGMLATAAALARYGTEEELQAFVRKSLPQASEDLIRGLVAGHLRHARQG